jgi:hypothetical protein
MVALPAPAAPSASLDADPWRAILDRVRGVRPGVASVLEHALPLEVTPERLAFGFAAGDSFLAARAGEPESLDLVTQVARAYFGAPTKVELHAAAAAPAGVRTVASIDAAQRDADLAKARLAVEKHPLVQEAIRLFGAQLREVRLPGGEG